MKRSGLLANALIALDGLSLGDAFGQLMSVRARSIRTVLETQGLPSPRWIHTDDTQMAMAVVEELAAHQAIASDSLAWRFVRRYQNDPGRGYGKGLRMQMEQIACGDTWQAASTAAFNGRGSKGNGAAMRVAPLGAYFSGDLSRVVSEARESAIVTHAHAEGIAGAVAVAIATAVVTASRGSDVSRVCEKLWDEVIARTPEGETKEGIVKARSVPRHMAPDFAARLLGSGFLVTAPDTVPFALWCAARHLDNYQEAMISTVEGDGDCDTNCAIVGGIVASFTGIEGIPERWISAREPLDLELPAQEEH